MCECVLMRAYVCISEYAVVERECMCKCLILCAYAYELYLCAIRHFFVREHVYVCLYLLLFVLVSMLYAVVVRECMCGCLFLCAFALVSCISV